MKRKVDPPSMGLFASLPIVVMPPTPPPAILPLGADVAFDLDELDDYHETETALRLVDPPRPSPRVIVELVGDHFEVSRLRDNGTTVANVRWTRSELEELVMRAQSALELK